MHYVEHLSKDKKLKKLIEGQRPSPACKAKESLQLSLRFYYEPAAFNESRQGDP